MGPWVQVDDRIHAFMINDAEQMLGVPRAKAIGQPVDRVAIPRQLLDAALNSMTQGLVTTDAGGRLQIWNNRFAAMLEPPDGAGPQQLPAPGLHAGMTIRDALARCHHSVAAVALALDRSRLDVVK